MPRAELQAAAAQLNDVLSVMSLETGLLCDNMDTLLRQQSQGGEAKLKNGIGYSTLMCILSHRADRIASKYLKREDQNAQDGWQAARIDILTTCLAV